MQQRTGQQNSFAPLVCFSQISGCSASLVNSKMFSVTEEYAEHILSSNSALASAPTSLPFALEFAEQEHEQLHVNLTSEYFSEVIQYHYPNFEENEDGKCLREGHTQFSRLADLH